MGTSSIYGGPNRSPLLPQDFEDGIPREKIPQTEDPGQAPDNDKPEEDKPDNNQGESSLAQESSLANDKYSSWTIAKANMSKFVSGNAGHNGKRNAVSSYVKGYGGSRNAAKSAKSAVRTTINIGNFFGGISQKGITEVLREYKILIEGRNPKEILNDVVNILSPIPNLREESVARIALLKTMSIIYEKFEDEDKDIKLLDSLDSNISEMLIEKYIQTYIYERLIHDMGSRIEKNAGSSSAAVRIEEELKEYIDSKVSLTLRGSSLSSINFSLNKVSIVVEGLYEICYKVLEDQL